tara:strand:+ start:1016 stop:1945 length:930 start_codon:yes stop_codon:yes gene_type:complete
MELQLLNPNYQQVLDDLDAAIDAENFTFLSNWNTKEDGNLVASGSEAWFSGNSSDYQFSGSSADLTVKDIGSGSKIDGVTNEVISTFENVEALGFKDTQLTTADALITTKDVFESNIINQITRTKSSANQVYLGTSSNYKFYNLGEDRYALKTDSGYDEITGVTSLQFSDKSLNLEKDIAGTFDQVTGLNTDDAKMFRLYNAAFARFPDASGLEYWIDKFSSGENDSRSVSSSFLISDEFKERYGANVTNAKYVETLYVNVLGRDYDQDGYNYWLGQLNSGQETRYELLLGFSESAENKALFTEMTGFG